ncbi:GTP-binding protein Era [Peptoclostridium litorale DSM 5388]|uniref:GTPase Era n=1 Tax=Peptoclostridium litorale DSM 5388 TaxID=1121324 RepID=A0A069REC2_PEPLI|nr:GTPase Era [Peptoclostridium litorale]KDR95088.1 GTPase Era [Peptoclostridium litorale DSM 5388]SIN75220.1 GTP-binding protein Era [Peptoclostridium litorale DSM 5388]
MSFKSGFVSVIGRPNVGKSTTINAIVGEKVAIISDKPQTTRNKIQAVYSDNDSQIVFIDTPGIHKPKNKLGEFMVKAANQTFNEVDLLIFMVDSSLQMGPGDSKIIENLKGIKTPKILVVNKIDTIEKEDLIKIVEKYHGKGIFDEIVPISAAKNRNVETLINVIKGYMEDGPKYFPDDMVTDQPERVIVSEIIREKVLLYTEKEVPHGVAVDIERIKKRKEKDIIDVSAVIYCERDSHKGIIIGKNGRKLKGIGKAAREEIEALFGSKVNLQTWVKVKENWRDRENYVKNFGYRQD